MVRQRRDEHNGRQTWTTTRSRCCGRDTPRGDCCAPLAEADAHYWGDLDTHGFAILDRLRAWLMDRPTLLEHQDRWGREPSPTSASLRHLTPDEAALYEDLVSDRFAERLRLEQERINWAWVQERLPL